MRKSVEHITIKRRRLGWLPAVLLALVLIWGYAGPVLSATAEDQVNKKVQFIHNFIRLSQWPAEAFSAPDEKLRLAVLGEDPFGGAIDQLTGKKVNNRPIEVVRYAPGQDVTDAHVLFISDSEQSRLGSILSSVSSRPVMTIGDMDRFAESGGMIAFSSGNSNGKIRFKINPEVAKAAGIKIGLELAKLGEIAHTEIAPEDLAGGTVRMAILPPWERRSPNFHGVRRGLYLSLAANEGVDITHVHDPKFAKKLKAETLKVKPEDSVRIWKGGGKYFQPDIEAIKTVASGLNVRAVFMFSDSTDTAQIIDKEVRAFLVDLKTGKIYQADKNNFSFETSGDYGNQVKNLPGELLRAYLDDQTRQPIRLAMLPARVPFPTWATGISNGLVSPLTSDQNINVTHVADAKAAKLLGLTTHKIPSSLNKDLWRKASKLAYAGPNLNAVKKAVDGLNTDVVLMYELTQDGSGSAHPGLRVYLIDINAERIYQVEKRLIGATGGVDGSNQVEGLLTGLVSDYLGNQGEQPTRLATAAPAEVITVQDVAIADRKMKSGPVRMVILPARSLNDATTHSLAGIDTDIYGPLRTNDAVMVTHAANADMANKIGVEKLDIAVSQSKRLWQPGSAGEHAQPDLEAIKAVVRGLNTDVVLMYSLPEHFGRTKLRVLLIDLKTDKVYQVDRSIAYDGFSYKQQVRDITSKLVSDYLNDQAPQPLRVAILPARHHIIGEVGNKADFRVGLFHPLRKNRQISIASAADPKLANQLGVDRLQLEAAERVRLWSKAGKSQHAQPKLEAIRDVVKTLNVRAVLMYSAPLNTTGPEVKVFLVDVETGKQYEVGGGLDYRGDPSLRLEGFMNRLLENYLDDQSRESQAEATASQPSQDGTSSKNLQ